LETFSYNLRNASVCIAFDSVQPKELILEPLRYEGKIYSKMEHVRADDTQSGFLSKYRKEYYLFYIIYEAINMLEKRKLYVEGV